MICPTDGTQLVMSERAGVEIDYCPKCRGVWLDRGELDKIIERAAETAAPAPRTPEPQRLQEPTRYGAPRDDDYRGDYREGGHYRKKRKESFLGDLFDF